MPYTISHINDPTHVEVTYSGVISPQELESAALEIVALMTLKQTPRLLADCSGIAGGHSVFDLYALADWAMSHAPHIREAVIIPTLPLSSDNVKFWETTCLNRGLQVRVFNDRASAETWLYGVPEAG